jgi:hypothetical protein
MNHPIVFIVTAFMVIGCADGENLEYRQIGDSPPGPGIVTGKQGAIILEFDPAKNTHSVKQADQ